MSASAVSKCTQKKFDRRRGRRASPIFSPDDRQIMMFDPDDEWWRVEARRGRGPHGASRRRARSPAERVRARPEVVLVINRGRDVMVNAGAVSEGATIFPVVRPSVLQI